MTTVNAYHQTLHFAFAKAATDRAAGTIAASQAAALAMDTSADCVTLCHVNGMPPAVAITSSTPQRDTALALSLSHRDQRAVAVATRSTTLRVGVDLERADGLSSSYARYFLTRAEFQSHGTLTLNQLWALKEAAWKALECDANTPYTALELGFGVHGELEKLRLRRQSMPVRALVFKPWSHLVCAVVFVPELS